MKSLASLIVSNTIIPEGQNERVDLLDIVKSLLEDIQIPCRLTGRLQQFQGYQNIYLDTPESQTIRFLILVHCVLSYQRMRKYTLV